MKRILLVVLVLALNGCVLAPLIESVKQLGVRRSDREMLLQKDLKNYHSALYWGDTQRAIEYATGEAKDNLRDILLEMKRKETRIVASEVELVEVSDSGFSAEVSVRVKAYMVPYYIVENTTHNETWSYSVVSGWKITDYSTEKEKRS